MTVFHYLFAIEYLKAALKLPIIMDSFDTENFEDLMEKANSTVKLVNLIFYILNLLTIILQMSLINVTESSIIFIAGNVAL